MPRSNHVVIVMEENHSYSQVVGNTADMPYLNSLISQYALATQFYSNALGSIPDYFMETTGQALDVFSTQNIDNIVRQMLPLGRTWKSYAESLPAVGWTSGDAYPYTQIHNPFAMLSDVVNSSNQVNNLVPFSQFPIDLANNQLPDYSYVVPNQNDNAHDCPAGLSTCTDHQKLQAADQWLATNIDPLIQNAAFQQDGILVIAFDESDGSDSTHGGGRVEWAVIGPQVKRGYQSTFSFYQFESTLRLSCEALGIAVSSCPAAGATAPSMGEFFTTAPTTGTISGTVTNAATGAAISGATVSYSGGSTTTNSSGAYTLSNVPAGSVSVTASATGFSSSSATVSVTGGATTTRNFALTATTTTGTISGTVTNSATGAAISGATVSYTGGSTTTNSSGAYTLSNVPAGSVSVTASAAGFNSSSATVSVTAGATTTQNFALAQASGGGGAPLLVQHAVNIAIGATSVSKAFPLNVTAGDLLWAYCRNGSGDALTISDSLSQKWTLVTSTHDGSGGAGGEQVFVWYAANTVGGPDVVTCRDASAANLEVGIVEAKNIATSAPLDQFAIGHNSSASPATAAVSTTAANEILLSACTWPFTSSMSVGAGAGFTLLDNALASGSDTGGADEYAIVPAAGSYAATMNLGKSVNWGCILSTFKSGSSTTTTTGTISGTVTNAATGAAISGATVSYTGGSTTTNSSGAYTLSNVPAGSVSVTASATGFNSSSATVSVTAGATTTQNFALTATTTTGTISGTVTNAATGAAISGATVSYTGGSTTTNSSGAYTLSNVPAGSVSVTAAATGFNSSTATVSVTAGATTTQNFALTATTTTGTITGTVTNSATGAAISGATVSYSGGSATTNSSGVYTLSNVPAGSVSLTASATGFNSSSATVSVTGGATTTRNFALTAVATTGTISGTVTNAATGAAISGATVSYSGGSATTNASGAYTLSNVPAGSVSLTAAATGFNSLSATVSVTAGATSTQNFSLVATGTIGGKTVQHAANIAIGATSVRQAFAANVTAGDLLYAYCRNGTGDALSISDSLGQKWTLVASVFDGSGGTGAEQVVVWYVANSAGGADTVTCSEPASANLEVGIVEVSGVATSTPLDQTATGHGNGTSAATSSVTTTSANEILLVACTWPFTTNLRVTAGTGWTLLDNPLSGGSDTGGADEAEIVSSTGSYTAAFTLGSAVNWGCILTTFK